MRLACCISERSTTQGTATTRYTILIFPWPILATHEISHCGEKLISRSRGNKAPFLPQLEAREGPASVQWQAVNSKTRSLCERSRKCRHIWRGFWCSEFYLRVHVFLILSNLSSPAAEVVTSLLGSHLRIQAYSKVDNLPIFSLCFPPPPPPPPQLVFLPAMLS